MRWTDPAESQVLGLKTTYDSLQITLSKKDTVVFGNTPGDTSIAAVPPFVKGANSKAGDPPWEWLLFGLVVVLSIFFLWWLFKRRPRRSGGGTAYTAAPTSSTVKTGAAQTGTTSETVSTGKETFDGAVAVITALQQSKAGGKVKIADVEIEIPPMGINVNINASGAGSSISDILIEAKNSETVRVDCVEDYREFNRKTGNQEQGKEAPVNGASVQ